MQQLMQQLMRGGNSCGALATGVKLMPGVDGQTKAAALRAPQPLMWGVNAGRWLRGKAKILAAVAATMGCTINGCN